MANAAGNGMHENHAGTTDPTLHCHRPLWIRSGDHRTRQTVCITDLGQGLAWSIWSMSVAGTGREYR